MDDLHFWSVFLPAVAQSLVPSLVFASLVMLALFVIADFAVSLKEDAE